MVAGRSWRTVFISGGGSGLGLYLAGKFLERGASVGAFDLVLRPEIRDQLGKLADGANARCSFHEVDVRDRDGLGRSVTDAVGVVGAPDLAINSAGVMSSKSFDTLAGEEFDRVVAINLLGSRNFAAAVLSHMGPGDRLALIASMAGIVANYGYAAYNASKFGVVGLAGALRLEYKPRGIGVSVICPPEVETPMVDTERSTGNPISLKLKEFTGTLTLEVACAEILEGLEQGRWMIVPGRRARWTRRLARILPGMMNSITDRMVSQALKSQEGS